VVLHVHSFDSSHLWESLLLLLFLTVILFLLFLIVLLFLLFLTLPLLLLFF
jgi:hypothetical protein